MRLLHCGGIVAAEPLAHVLGKQECHPDGLMAILGQHISAQLSIGATPAPYYTRGITMAINCGFPIDVNPEKGALNKTRTRLHAKSLSLSGKWQK